MIDRICEVLRFKKPAVGDGVLFASGTTVPGSVRGYRTGCIFQKTDGSAGTSLYINEGSVNYSVNNIAIKEEDKHTYFSICAPYLEVIEEMTALEFLKYHANFKPFKKGIDPTAILNEIGLIKSKDKQIRYYSSGMKQRIKLAQAFFSDTPLLLLDEPCTNLDQKGIDLYNHLIATLCSDRLVLISSNDKTEYRSCAEEIKIGV